MMRALALIFLLAGCVTTGAPATTSEPITLAERFERTALSEDDGAPRDRLFRWEQPYRVYVRQTGERRLPSITPVLEEISARTGLEAERVFTRTGIVKPTVALLFVSREDLQQWADLLAEMNDWPSIGEFTCFAIWMKRGLHDDVDIYAPGNGDVLGYKGWIFIRNDLSPEDVEFCLWQEMIQILGLPGDMDDRTDTVFRSAYASETGPTRPTAADLAVLELLYNPAIRNGMPRAEALATVRRLTAG